jgi:hypothetical protein
MKSSLHQIFIKYVNDDCSEEEIRQLLAYFQISTEEDYLKELIINELGAEDAVLYEPADTDARIEGVYKKVGKAISKQKLSISHIYRSWPFRSAAAALLILLGGTFWMLQRPKAVKTVGQEVILPGKDQAVLTTGDGHRIALGGGKNEVIQLTNGGTVRKTANGQIEYIPYGKTGQQRKGEKNTITTPAGGQWQVTLPDGTRVWLNASSSITYEVPFNEKERKIILSGEAYFEVSKHPDQPFKVVCPDQEINVLGTSFNVMAYPDEHNVKTTLVTGAVSISSSSRTVKLMPGEQAITNEKGIQVVRDADQEEAIAWKDGYFKFNGNLEDIMNRISRWYDVEIIYENKPSATESFEGEISRSRGLEEVLRIIEYTGKVHFTTQGRTIIVTK